MATKIKVFETLVLSSLLCNSETLNTKAVSKHRLQVFEMKWHVSRISYKNRKTVIQTRLYWKPHTEQKFRSFGENESLQISWSPITAMHGYVYGKSNQGRLKTRWINVIRDNCDKTNAFCLAHDRRFWRESVEGNKSSQLSLCFHNDIINTYILGFEWRKASLSRKDSNRDFSNVL